MRPDAAVEFIYLHAQFFMTGNCVPQFYKGSHDEDAHFDSLFAVENVRRHEGTVFGEGTG